MQRSIVAFAGLSLWCAVAAAQTPLVERYSAFFAIPFERGDDLALVSMNPGDSLPLGFVQNLAHIIFERREQDRLRITRAIERPLSATGYEDVNGDGIVTSSDLAALDEYLFAKVHALAPDASDDDLDIPRPFDINTLPDPERYAPLVAAIDAMDRVCIELGCDSDDDGVDDLDDLCPELADPQQGDVDGDGVGDACDSDHDNNGVSDMLENCLGYRGEIVDCVRVVRDLRGKLKILEEIATDEQLALPPASLAEMKDAVAETLRLLGQAMPKAAGVALGRLESAARALVVDEELDSLVRLLARVSGYARLGLQKPVTFVVACADLGIEHSAEESCAVVLGAADTYIRNGPPNSNYGASSELHVSPSANTRTLLSLDIAPIRRLLAGATLASATLELDIVSNGNDWSPAGRPLSLHRMRHAWAEYSVTWRCADDSTSSNASAAAAGAAATPGGWPTVCSGGACTRRECAPEDAWEMGNAATPEQVPWEPQPVATVLANNGQTDALAFDVTDEIRSIAASTQAHHGWILKKNDEQQNGRMVFSSSESTTATPPRLVVHYAPAQ